MEIRIRKWIYVLFILMVLNILKSVSPYFTIDVVKGDTLIVFEYDANYWTIDQPRVDGTVKGTNKAQVSKSLEIKNNSGDLAVLSFSYAVELKDGNYRLDNNLKKSSVVIDGNAVSGNGNITKELQAGESIIVTLVGGRASAISGSPGEAKIHITDLSLTLRETTSVKFLPSSINYTISYYENDTATEMSQVDVADSEVELSGEKTKGFTVSASGYVCVGAEYSYVTTDENHNPITVTGYMSPVGGKIIPENGYVITPIFLVDEGADNKGPFSVNGTYYWTWESAFSAAGSGGTVVLMENYELPEATDVDVLSRNGFIGSVNANYQGNYVMYTAATDDTEATITYTVPAGASLLLPYSTNDTSILSGTSQTNDFKHANVNFVSSNASTVSNMIPSKSVTFELIIPEKSKVCIADGSDDARGRIVVGGTIVGSEGSGYYEGGTYGAHSNLVVNGTLELGNYAVLSAAGYVYGTGQINAEKAGAELYQPMVLMDWRGAGAAPLFIDTSLNAKVKIHSEEEGIAPFSQWGSFNIQTKTKIQSGNYMYLYASLREDSDAYCSHPVLVGDDSIDGLVHLHSGSYLESEYKPIAWSSSHKYGFPGKTEVTITGGADVGVLSLTLKLPVGSVTVSTNDFTCPISYCYSVVLKTGTYNINKPVSLLPGAEMIVEEGAVLNIGTHSTEAIRVMVLDGLLHRVLQNNSMITSGEITHTIEYATSRKDNKNYPTTTELQNSRIGNDVLSGNAEFVVNGTVVLGSKANFGGVIQTEGSGKIDALAGTGGEIPSATVQIGVTGYKKVLGIYYRYCAGMSLHTQTARIVSDNGVITDIVRGNTYYGTEYESTLDTYSFKYYAEANNVNNVVLIGDVKASSGETVTSTQTAYTLNETLQGAWIHDHNYGEGVTVASTCTEKGTVTYTCTLTSCGHKKTEEIEALGHNEIVSPRTEPSCTESGLGEGKYCERCKEVLVVQAVIPATGHTEVTDTAVAPTCTTTGLTEGSHCSVCGHVINAQQEVPALGHTTVTDAAVAPSCTETGLTEGSHCSICNEVFKAQEVIQPLGHEYKSEVTKEATCGEDGVRTYICIRGDHTYTETIQATGNHVWSQGICTVCGQKSDDICEHQYGEAAVTPPTCTDVGYTTKICTICGYSHISNTVQATGHSWVGPTCTEAQYCSICNAEGQPLTGHSYVTVVTMPTCTTDGYSTHTCSVCQDTYTDTPVPALGHAMGEWIITTKPTSQVIGEETRTCIHTDCTEKETRPIIALYGTSVRVGDSLDLYFYVRKDMLQGESYYAEITRDYADDTKTKDVVDPFTQNLAHIAFEDWESYGDYYRFCYEEIAGKEMTDKVSVTLYHNNGVYASTTSTETIANYALRTLKSTTNAELRTVLVDMLVYGAACQDYFGDYHMDDLATAKLTEDQLAYATPETNEKSWNKLTNPASPSFSASVTAETNLIYSFIFTDTSFSKAVVTYQDHYGKSQSLEATGSARVDVTDLAVADGRQVLTCTLYDENENTIGSVDGSIESYVATIWVNHNDPEIMGTATDRWDPVFEKLMYFVDSAYAYFH